MFDWSMQARLQDAQRRNHTGLPVGEYLEEALRRAREEHLEESRYVDEAIRQWWLDEQGWQIDSATPGRPASPSEVGRLCQAVGEILIAWGVWLTRQAKPAADLGA